MSQNRSVCVFLGDREDAARSSSRLLARGIPAQYSEDRFDSVLEAMGGTRLAKVLVAPEDLERATAVLAELDFQ